MAQYILQSFIRLLVPLAGCLNLIQYFGLISLQ